MKEKKHHRKYFQRKVLTYCAQIYFSPQKKRRRKYISYKYTLSYNAGNSYSHYMCAKYDINIMGMINETSQNDQKKKSLRDLTMMKYHCLLLEPILVNDRSFTNSHGGQFLSGETVKTDKIQIAYNLNFICAEFR